MRQTIINGFFLIILVFAIINCASRGTPTGGEKDTTPPEIVKTEPENYTTNFSSDEIKIVFNEYVKIKDLQKHLIISPPLKTQPEIKPLGGASKSISIKIFDTLLPNTTYAFNFGNSIVDNNEENPFPYYRYVFSTGNYIDSLSVKGSITDALAQKPDNFISVMLYDVTDTTFTDSIIYKSLPKYITNTQDSTSTFSIENIKSGSYLLVALKDENKDYKYQQKTDKIAFYSKPIMVPSDTVMYKLKMFKEFPDFKVTKPRQVAGQKIAFGYEGDYKEMHIKILSNVPDNFTHKITKDPKADSLLYWFKPNLEIDSLAFSVSKNNTVIDTFLVRYNNKLRDSIKLIAQPNGTFNLNDTLKISSVVPFQSIDTSRIKIIDKDSVNVAFTTVLDTLKNTYKFVFKKTESNNYKLQALPNAFIDFFEKTNDTLHVNLKTKAKADYGNIRVLLKNATYPVIVQLVDDKGLVKAALYSTRNEPLDFTNLHPANYYLRVIYDENANGIYDAGNYLKKIQPEHVFYYSNTLELNANWDLIETFTLP